MAISDRIRAEAKRTIVEIQKFYDTYGDGIDDAEEREHRIARVEASMEGCNGLSQDDKIQKTAENVFELTCAQERSYDSLRREMKLSRAEHAKDFGALKKNLQDGLKEIAEKIEASGMDSSASLRKDQKGMNAFIKTISQHPLMAFSTFLVILVLTFISGHFDDILKVCSGN
jgi:hypothetical protein